MTSDQQSHHPTSPSPPFHPPLHSSALSLPPISQNINSSAEESEEATNSDFGRNEGGGEGGGTTAAEAEERGGGRAEDDFDSSSLSSSLSNIDSSTVRSDCRYESPSINKTTK
mmetsp:Transcript_666/g.2081  ORF Transcript_666/g.2081 Transcript_666/m.2081 type:complete len:113 (+) Transcript_666:1633-1971(+)